MRFVRSAGAAGLACCALTAAGAARGQAFGSIEQAPQYSRGFNVAVRERPHPEWAPLDFDLGGFTLQPQLAVTTLYNDNEKYATTDAQSDVSFRIQPALQLSSNWNQNGVSLSAFVARTEYARFSEDDSTEYGVTGAGRLDVQNDLTVDLRASDQHLVLARSDPDVPVDSIG